MTPDDVSNLADYRRRTHEMYAAVRAGGSTVATWEKWRNARDDLFRNHAQSAVDSAQRRSFAGLRYFDHDDQLRFDAAVEPIEASPVAIDHSAAGSTAFVPVGTISLRRIGIDESLTIYWLDGYGGGLFLPFRDGTSGSTTYGGGRYLLDSVKGADLGANGGKLTIDFNYAYHPSCVHSTRWSCPLAPPGNRLATSICAGERLA